MFTRKIAQRSVQRRFESIGTGTGTGTEPVKDSTPSFGSIISTLGTLGLAGTGTFELVKFVKHEVKDAVSPIEKNVEDVKMKVENIEASVNKNSETLSYLKASLDRKWF